MLAYCTIGALSLGKDTDWPNADQLDTVRTSQENRPISMGPGIGVHFRPGQIAQYINRSFLHLNAARRAGRPLTRGSTGMDNCKLEPQPCEDVILRQLRCLRQFLPKIEAGKSIQQHVYSGIIVGCTLNPGFLRGEISWPLEKIASPEEFASMCTRMELKGNFAVGLTGSVWYDDVVCIRNVPHCVRIYLCELDEPKPWVLIDLL